MKPIVKIALACLLLAGNVIPAFSSNTITCRGLLIKEEDDAKRLEFDSAGYSLRRKVTTYRLKPDSPSKCNAEIPNDDPRRKLLDMVLKKCQLNDLCFIKGSTGGHGVVQWKDIISVRKIQ